MYRSQTFADRPLSLHRELGSNKNNQLIIFEQVASVFTMFVVMCDGDLFNKILLLV